MAAVNMLDAKSSLSRLVESLESGAETEIVIARNGKPAARLVPLEAGHPAIRLGAGVGRFTIPDPDEALDAEVALLFQGRSTSSYA